MGLLAQGEACVLGLTHAPAAPWRVDLSPEPVFWCFRKLSHFTDLAFHKFSFLILNGS